MINPFEIIETRLGNIERLLLDIKSDTKDSASPSEADRWFDIEEVCLYLPSKPARATIYHKVHFNEIPFHKGTGEKKLRFLKSEIDTWLNQGKRKSNSEIRNEASNYIKSKK